MVGMEFFNVIFATGDHNEDSVSRVNKNKNVKKIQAVTNNTDMCQISDIKRGYSINEDFQNV